jgi:AraC-like DNA-binding protein
VWTSIYETIEPSQAIKGRYVTVLREQTHFWPNSALGASFDALTATYVTHSFSRHTHEGFAIGVIERGAETFYYRGDMHIAPAGSIVVINPGELHTGQAVAPEGWTYRMIYPEAELLRQAASHIAARTVSVPFFGNPVIRDPLIFQRLRLAHLALERSAPRLEQETRLLHALTLMVRRYADGSLSSSDFPHTPDALQRARDYIHAHYGEDISLETLAQSVYLSPYHLSRLFHERFGLPPHAYLNQVRVTQAKALLNQGYEVADVSLAVGFADQSHLTRAFKRIIGVAPGQYRKIRQDGYSG